MQTKVFLLCRGCNVPQALAPSPWCLGTLSGHLLRKLWGTAVSATLGTVTSNGTALWWHPVAHVTCYGVPEFQVPWAQKLLSLASNVSAVVTQFHRQCQCSAPMLLTGCCRLLFTIQAAPTSPGLLEAAELLVLILLSP